MNLIYGCILNKGQCIVMWRVAVPLLAAGMHACITLHEEYIAML